MAEQKLEIKIGRAYELKDGRVGTLKFEGKTFFKPGVVWYGFEVNANLISSFCKHDYNFCC